MPLFFVDSTKQPFASFDVVFDWELPILSDTEESVSALALLDCLPYHVRDQFTAFFDALGIDYPDNLGRLVYNDNRELVYYAFPSIGMFERQPTLKIGDKISFDGVDYSANYIPLEYKDNSYYLMGNKLEFYRVMDQQNPTTTIRAYLKLKKNIEGGISTFMIPVRVDKDVNYDKLEADFDAGKLDQHLNGFSQVYGSATKLFAPAFKNGLFPQEGVMMLLTSGRLNSTEWSGQTIESVSFQILASSAPDIEVQIGNKDNPEFVALEEVGSLSFAKSTLPFSLWVNALIDNKTIIAVHFYEQAVDGQGNKKADWTPKHVATKDVRRLPPASKKFALELAKQYQIQITGSNNAPALAEATQSPAKPVAKPSGNNPPKPGQTPAKGTDKAKSENVQTVDTVATTVKPENSKNTDKDLSKIPF